MEVFLIRVLQLILALTILVFLHEGGHFFFAKLFGVRVDKFYIFFDWKFSLFKFKPKNSDTEYGIGWIPLGGYCKIAGMIDESFDTDQMKQPEQPWEFRTKPTWQRLLIMIGGVLVNFLLALFIYSQILFWWGDSLIGTEKREFKEFGANLYRDISEAHRVDIIRDGKPMSISLPGEINMLNMIKADPAFVRPLMPALVDSVLPGTPAAKIGIQKGDKILAINGSPVDSYNEFTDQLGRRQDMLLTSKTSADSLKARTVVIAFGNDTRTDTTQVVLTPDLKLGFVVKSLAGLYQPKTIEYSFLESIPAGIKYGWNVLASYVDDMKYVFTAEGAKSLGGFGAIGSLFPPMWDWYMFWKMTAFLSIILAFMNILPIPALDGGHVLFLLYEMITRRKPSEEFMIRAEYVGFGLLILLMVAANLNDILRWLGYI